MNIDKNNWSRNYIFLGFRDFENYEKNIYISAFEMFVKSIEYDSMCMLCNDQWISVRQIVRPFPELYCYIVNNLMWLFI